MDGYLHDDRVQVYEKDCNERFCRTNTDPSEMEAALAYKGLWQVERAFREIKTTFEIRPMYLPW